MSRNVNELDFVPRLCVAVRLGQVAQKNEPVSLTANSGRAFIQRIEPTTKEHEAKEVAADMHTFDRVFDRKASQDLVYMSILQKYAQASANGANTAVILHGTKDSGKEFTVLGTARPNEQGVLASALADIFAVLDRRKFENCEWGVALSVADVKGSIVRDLVKKHDLIQAKEARSELLTKLQGSSKSVLAAEPPINLKDCYITGTPMNVSLNYISSPSEGLELVDTVLSLRAHETKLEAETQGPQPKPSGRFHTLFRITVSRTDLNTGEEQSGSVSILLVASLEKGKDVTPRDLQTINNQFKQLYSACGSFCAHPSIENPKRSAASLNSRNLALVRLLQPVFVDCDHPDKRKLGMGNDQSYVVWLCSLNPASSVIDENFNTLQTGSRLRVAFQKNTTPMKTAQDDEKGDTSVHGDTNINDASYKEEREASRQRILLLEAKVAGLEKVLRRYTVQKRMLGSTQQVLAVMSEEEVAKQKLTEGYRSACAQIETLENDLIEKERENVRLRLSLKDWETRESAYINDLRSVNRVLNETVKHAHGHHGNDRANLIAKHYQELDALTSVHNKQLAEQVERNNVLEKENAIFRAAQDIDISITPKYKLAQRAWAEEEEKRRMLLVLKYEGVISDFTKREKDLKTSIEQQRKTFITEKQALVSELHALYEFADATQQMAVQVAAEGPRPLDRIEFTRPSLAEIGASTGASAVRRNQVGMEAKKLQSALIMRAEQVHSHHRPHHKMEAKMDTLPNTAATSAAHNSHARHHPRSEEALQTQVKALKTQVHALTQERNRLTKHVMADSKKRVSMTIAMRSQERMIQRVQQDSTMMEENMKRMRFETFKAATRHKHQMNASQRRDKRRPYTARSASTTSSMNSSQLVWEPLDLGNTRVLEATKVYTRPHPPSSSSVAQKTGLNMNATQRIGSARRAAQP